MVKRIVQLVMAAIFGLLVFEIGPGTLFSFGPFSADYCSFVVICLAVISLGTPRGLMWLTLACWAFYFGWWSVYELHWLSRGDNKFGPMMIPYGIAGLVLGVASWLKFHGRDGAFQQRKALKIRE